MLNRFATVAAAALITFSPGGATHQVAPGASLPEDRMSFDELSAMVAGPAALLEGDDPTAAVTAFEALLARQAARHGEASIEIADHLMAFALALFEQSEAELRRRSLDYFERSIAAYRAALGPGHPEVALAIGTYADGALRLQPDDPPLGLEAELEIAHRIRAATRGPDHVVTASALLQIARVLGAPSRTRRDPQGIAIADNAFRRAIRALEPQPAFPHSQTAYAAYFALARMYVQNGRLTEALATVTEAGRHLQHVYPRDAQMCRAFGRLSGEFDGFLSDRGFEEEARALSRTYELAAGPCPDVEQEQNPIFVR